MRAAVLALAAGCYTGAVPAPPANSQPQEALVLDGNGLGPIRRDTEVSLAELRSLFPAYRVEPHGRDASFLFNLYEGEELMFYVVPANATAPYGTAFGVHAKSPRIAEREHGWRVGNIFVDRTAIDHCECWGLGEVVACYRSGDRVAIAFERTRTRDGELACAGILGAAIDTVIGSRIDRLVWQPSPFG